MSYQDNSFATGLYAPGASSYSCVFQLPNKAGSCLVAELTYELSAGSLSLADSAGNSWVRQGQLTSGSVVCELWAAVNVRASGNFVTVTATGGTITALAISIHEYTGVVASPIDAVVFTNHSVSTVSPTLIPASLTTTHGPDIIHAFQSFANMAPWAASSNYGGVGQPKYVYDPAGNLQQVWTSGTSGSSAPGWNDTGAGVTIPATGLCNTRNQLYAHGSPPPTTIVTFTIGGNPSPFLQPGDAITINSIPTVVVATEFTNRNLASGEMIVSGSYGTLTGTTWSANITGPFTTDNTVTWVLLGNASVLINPYNNVNYPIGVWTECSTDPVEYYGSGAGGDDTAFMDSWDVPVPFAATFNLSVGYHPIINGEVIIGIIALKSIAFGVPTVITSADIIVVNEPSLGFTNRTPYLDKVSGHSFTMQLRQRGSGNLTFIVGSGDTYTPEMGTLVYIFDQPVSGAICAFIGTIDDIKTTWPGEGGTRVIELTVVTLEQCFDVLPVGVRIYLNQTADQIVQDLLSNVCIGVPIAAVNIVTPAIAVANGWLTPANIQSLICDYSDKVSDVFDQLAEASQYVWGIEPATQTFYFCPPQTIGSPFNLTSVMTMMNGETGDSLYIHELKRADFRDSQSVKINISAFGPSSEAFGLPGDPVAYDGNIQDPNGSPFVILRSPPLSVTDAWLTQDSQNAAIGTFSGQPSPGDTITIGLVVSPWTPNFLYGVGNSVLDSAGHQQNCIVGGTSGSSVPTWNDQGGQTPDGTVRWQDVGPTTITYSFQASLANTPTANTPNYNTQWGIVVIGATLAQTGLNLVDAINGADATRGVAYSYPTWEHPVVSATGFNTDLFNFTVHAKSSGQNFVSTLSTTSSNFSWDASATRGGVSASFQTQTLSVGQAVVLGTNQVAWTPGVQQVDLGLKPAKNQRIQIQYQRVGGDIIICERTDLVVARAAIESGTGKYHQHADDTNNQSAYSGLQECQNGLQAYSVIPVIFEFETYQPGLVPGQLLTVNFSNLPAGIGSVLPNGTYVIEEVVGNIDLVYVGNVLTGGGRIRYHVYIMNVNQIASYMDFWKSMSSGGSGASIVGGGGGFLPQVPATPPTPVSLGLPGGLNVMSIVTGAVTPDLSSNLWVQSVSLTVAINVNPPIGGAAGDTFIIEIYQPASPPGFGVTFSSYYTGLSEFVLDTRPSTYASLMFQIQPGATSANLLMIIMNGNPVA